MYKIPKQAQIIYFKNEGTNTSSGWYCSKIDIQSLVDNAFELGKNRILRKWKKAMEWVVIIPKGDLANYHRHLNEEYLKAKEK